MPETRRSAGSATTPPEAAVRSQLHAILASDAFVRARRSSDFLHYIVDKTLNGEEDALSGQSIAVAVFGRDAEFDAAGDRSCVSRPGVSGTQEMVPDLAATVRSDLGLWQFDEPTLNRIVEGLRLAGLDVL